MNTHLLCILVFLALVGLTMFCGWQIPDLVVVAPLIALFLYVVADVSFMVRKVYHGHREMNRKAILDAGAEIQATVELTKTRNKLAKQQAQHAKKRAKAEPIEGQENPGHP